MSFFSDKEPLEKESQDIILRLEEKFSYFKLKYENSKYMRDDVF